MALKTLPPPCSQDQLREILNYDPETGLFTWRRVSSPRMKTGDPAGCVQKGKYPCLRIWIGGKLYLASRLAWFYMTGQWPKTVDHEDLNSLNNKWRNLRNATSSQNAANKKTRPDSVIGLKGVRKFKKSYFSRIQVDGNRRYIGPFSCPVAAHLAYIVEADKEFGAFARAA